MKLYVAGPMSGLPDFNRPAFHEAAHRLESLGYKVASPATLAPPCESPEWSDWMRPAIAMMLACTGVAMLPSWTSSRGATLERDLALGLGMDVRPLATWLEAA